MNTFKTLEQVYLDMAEECQAKGDGFGAQFWRLRAYEVSCL